MPVATWNAILKPSNSKSWQVILGASRWANGLKQVLRLLSGHGLKVQHISYQCASTTLNALARAFGMISKKCKSKGFCSHCSLFVYNIINIFWKSLLLRASRTVSIVSTIANHNRELSSICHPDFLQPDACNGTMFRRPQAPRKAITAASAVPLMKPSAVHKVGFLMLWTEGYIMIWTDLMGFDASTPNHIKPDDRSFLGLIATCLQPQSNVNRLNG